MILLVPEQFSFESERSMLELLGRATYEEFCSITGNSFIGMVHPNDRQRVTEEITSQIKCGNTDAVTYRLNRPDGAEVSGG